MLKFDYFSAWNFLVAVAVFAAGGFFILRSNKAAYVKVLKDTSDGWERAYKQKETDLINVSAQLQALKDELQKVREDWRIAVHDLRNDIQNITALNVKLQIHLAERDAVIERLQGQVRTLRLRVAHLEGSTDPVIEAEDYRAEQFGRIEDTGLDTQSRVKKIETRVVTRDAEIKRLGDEGRARDERDAARDDPDFQALEKAAELPTQAH